MNERVEHDSMGEITVDADKLWGAQTERSRRNFVVGKGHERMPRELVSAIALIKEASALANRELLPEKMTEEKCSAICKVAEEIRAGKLDEHFPLVVFQTGSGTQTNMNVNEVIANKANADCGKKLLHPNDDVNLSQSSNDVVPSAIRVAGATAIADSLFPALEEMIVELTRLEKENEGIIKCGRTHFQDATPIAFSQEISGWRASIEKDRKLLLMTLPDLSELALGGTAVGTGLNAPEGFDQLVAEKVADLSGLPFTSAKNKFHALTSLDEIVFAHGALKALAADLWKIANDVRFLASGPRAGLGEISIPENEPGSSIMPGKVNPTQCEALSMVACQVMGNDTTIAMAASQGNFELNVFLPVVALNFLQSIRLLSEAITSFCDHCLSGLVANKEKMKENLEKSLMTVTALVPIIGYEKAAKIAQLARAENKTLREACLTLGYLTEEEFDKNFHPEEMV